MDKKELDVEMSHLVASVEVKGDVAEEGTGNDGNLKRKRKVNRKHIDDWYDGDEPKKAKQHGNEMGEVDIGLDKDYERGYTRKPDIWEIPHSYSKSLAPFIEQIVACGI